MIEKDIWIQAKIHSIEDLDDFNFKVYFEHSKNLDEFLKSISSKMSKNFLINGNPNFVCEGLFRLDNNGFENE